MASERPRELLLVVGRVETMAPTADGRPADAILVRDGRIAAVGSGAELRREAADGVEVVDLPGTTVLPGINDSHVHVASWGATRPPLALDVSPRAVGSIADIAQAVRAAAHRAPVDEWIRGSGWHLASLAECVSGERRSPTRQDLDAVAPDHPVALADFSQHALWVNSRALAIAGVDASTETPAGGDIPRDEHGEPIGILSEFSAQRLVARHMPTFTREERKAAIREATAELHRLGITSLTDPALGPGGGDGILGTETLRAYEELLLDGELKLRVNVLLLFGAEGSGTADDVARGLREVRVDSGDERWLRDAGMKIFADGIPPLYTSWLSEPYAGDERKGSLVIPGGDDDERVAELFEMVRLGHAAGRQVGIHATGDRAIDAVVDAFASAQRRHPRDDPRHYVIHGDLASAATLRAMARHGVGLNVQPQIKIGAAELMASLLGEERAAYQWPNRLALDTGVWVAFSSDAPVCWPDWREGVAGAVLRRSLATGAVAGPEQRITVREALHAYTVGGAYQDFAEHFKGTIEPGHVADLCVLEADPLEVDPEDIPAIEVAATFVDGEAVFTK
jgi:predicted amidohydrolase YtcJ